MHLLLQSQLLGYSKSWGSITHPLFLYSTPYLQIINQLLSQVQGFHFWPTFFISLSGFIPMYISSTTVPTNISITITFTIWPYCTICLVWLEWTSIYLEVTLSTTVIPFALFLCLTVESILCPFFCRIYPTSTFPPRTLFHNLY